MIPVAGVLFLTAVWAVGLPEVETLWEYLMRGQSYEFFIYEVSGRREIWEASLQLFKESPFLGFGFHADRFLLEGQQMHNGFFHALVQTGLLGILPFVGAFASAWVLLVRTLSRLNSVSFAERYWLIEVAGVLVFLTVLSISQSTGAFYGVEWLLLAPLFAYVQILGRNQSFSVSNSTSERVIT